VALAQLIFGKAGAQLLPFLHELSAAGELHARITTERRRRRTTSTTTS